MEYTSTADKTLSAIQASYDLMCENAEHMTAYEWECEMKRHARMLQTVSKARVDMEICGDNPDCKKNSGSLFRSSMAKLSGRACSKPTEVAKAKVAVKRMNVDIDPQIQFTTAVPTSGTPHGKTVFGYAGFFGLSAVYYGGDAGIGYGWSDQSELPRETQVVSARLRIGRHHHG